MPSLCGPNKQTPHRLTMSSPMAGKIPNSPINLCIYQNLSWRVVSPCTGELRAGCGLWAGSLCVNRIRSCASACVGSLTTSHGAHVRRTLSSSIKILFGLRPLPYPGSNRTLGTRERCGARPRALGIQLGTLLISAGGRTSLASGDRPLVGGHSAESSNSKKIWPSGAPSCITGSPPEPPELCHGLLRPRSNRTGAPRIFACGSEGLYVC